MRTGTSLTAYVNPTQKAKFDKVKKSYMDRSPDIPLSDSAAIMKMIDDTYGKIEGKETNANRITTIIERLDTLEGTVDHKLTEMANIIKELVEVLKGGDS